MTGQSGGIYNSYSTVAMDLWRRKQTLSSGCALGLGRFTAINPWPRAITITYNIRNNINISKHHVLRVILHLEHLPLQQETAVYTRNHMMSKITFSPSSFFLSFYGLQVQLGKLATTLASCITVTLLTERCSDSYLSFIADSKTFE